MTQHYILVSRHVFLKERKEFLEHPCCARINWKGCSKESISQPYGKSHTQSNTEYGVFTGPKFISDNYMLIGTDLHGFPDAHPGIHPDHQILQHPVYIGTGTYWSKIKYTIVIGTYDLVKITHTSDWNL